MISFKSIFLSHNFGAVSLRKGQDYWMFTYMLALCFPKTCINVSVSIRRAVAEGKITIQKTRSSEAIVHDHQEKKKKYKIHENKL